MIKTTKDRGFFYEQKKKKWYKSRQEAGKKLANAGSLKKMNKNTE